MDTLRTYFASLGRLVIECYPVFTLGMVIGLAIVEAKILVVITATTTICNFRYAAHDV